MCTIFWCEISLGYILLGIKYKFPWGGASSCGFHLSWYLEWKCTVGFGSRHLGEVIMMSFFPLRSFYIPYTLLPPPSHPLLCCILFLFDFTLWASKFELDLILHLIMVLYKILSVNSKFFGPSSAGLTFVSSANCFVGSDELSKEKLNYNRTVHIQSLAKYTWIFLVGKSTHLVMIFCNWYLGELFL